MAIEIVQYTANIYRQFAGTGCDTFATVVLMQLSHAMAVHMNVNDCDENIYSISTAICCNCCCQTTLAKVTLTKVILSAVKLFVVNFQQMLV